MYIGGHVSASGGLSKTIQNAEKIGANTIQIFGTSPYSWSITKHSEEEIAKFKVAYKAAKLGPIYLHAPYIVNLASPDPILVKRSELSLEGNLRIAESIGAEGVIFHIGSSKGSPKEEARAQVSKSVRDILKKVSGKSALILENSAGGGDGVGVTLEDIGRMIKAIDSPRTGLCFDTAHAFEAGIIEKYDSESVEELEKKIRSEIGVKHFFALHVNDSKTAWNSHHDRHENIGKGLIGLEGFRVLAQNEFMKSVPWLLEVPGFTNEGPDKKNIEIVKSLL